MFQGHTVGLTANVVQCVVTQKKRKELNGGRRKKNKKKDLETGIKIQRTLKEEILSPFLVILQ